MKLNVSVLAMATGASASVVRDTGCCAAIKAYGADGPLGPVGQLSDGQNRIGDSSLPPGKYCPNDKTGGLFDGNWRGCILTPPTTQWQCDKGASPTGGFAVSCNGTLSHDGGDTTFFACPTGMNGGFNLYSKQIDSEPGCKPVWLRADGCKPECAPPAPPPPPPPAPSPRPPAACPGELTGAWEFPHLIIPINAAAADTAYHTSYNGTASGAISSLFTFDIPSTFAGKTCSLKFLFPTQEQLETSAYTYSGAGQFEFAILERIATQETTYATAPKVAYVFDTITLKPGTSVDIGSCPDGCPAGKAMSFLMKPLGDSYLNYFQDSNPCPIGLYVTAS